MFVDCKKAILRDCVYLIHSSEDCLRDLKSIKQLIRESSYRKLQDSLFDNPIFRGSGMYGSYRRINLLSEVYYNIIIKRLFKGIEIVDEIDKCILDAVLKSLKSYTTVEELIDTNSKLADSIFFHVSDKPYKYKQDYKGRHTISIPLYYCNLDRFKKSYEFELYDSDHADPNSKRLDLEDLFYNSNSGIYHPEIAIQASKLDIGILRRVCGTK